ncbi:uncharacterized protein [Gossypium hirsutum]|uniref:CCHC-type domain-containing protein n=1 Tax=Gossypium hirsutum TaxID=3635 RepID=A0A1U8KTQ6_GOSHI|nr:uncharacterized protein LOC107919426 [Gossypium hirsutum]
MAVFVDLDKPLVSQVLVNGELQRVEYEALPTICFSCDKYGHLKKLCASPATGKGNETGKISGFSEVTESTTGGEGLAFGPWMVVEQKFKRGLRNLQNQREGDTEKEILGSIFSALKGLENQELRTDDRVEMISVVKGGNSKGKENLYAVVIEKSKEHSCKNKVGEGPCPLTNGASHLGLRSVGQVAKALAQRQNKSSGPFKIMAGPFFSSAGLQSIKNPKENSVGNLLGPKLQLDATELAVADLGDNKHL